ncbi:MAG: exosome complex RNA-binding protein Csl4 [Candidatus Diapherotrites archaeon]|nr:exosome complex RNA-binding protein Csl4 [Candidatus Diapherotrites archaeon]
MAIKMKRIVVPGEDLAEVEEFIEGENTYQEGEKVRSAVVGFATYDSKSHEVKVVPDKRVKVFEIGTKVIGQVVASRKTRILVNIAPIECNDERIVLPKTKATLFVSKIADRFVKEISEEYKIGDIIVAEIDDIKPYGLYLRTNKPNLGVLKAFCSRCRSPLHYNNAKLLCKKCGSIEHRKISSEYSIRD